MLTVQTSPTTTFPVVTKVDDIKKDTNCFSLYLAIVILAALLFIVMIILAVVLILLRKKQQQIGTRILFAFSFKFKTSLLSRQFRGKLDWHIIQSWFNNNSFPFIWQSLFYQHCCLKSWSSSLWFWYCFEKIETKLKPFEGSLFLCLLLKVVFDFIH